MYNVVESFYSIQGEGSWAGRPATFIRLYGCNLACSFCDEPLHKDENNITRMNNQEILELCKNSDRVVITGGEPSLNDLNSLIKYLQKSKKLVAVETNGYNYYNIHSADLKTLAPKNFERPRGTWHDVKLLVCHKNKEKVVDEIKYWAAFGDRVFLSAINNESTLDMDNNRLATEMCLEYGVTINVQLHKILGVR